MQRMTDPVATMLAADRASRDLGIELLESGPGRATARMTVTANMVNGHGLAHGAFVFAVADTAFACACNSHGPVTVASGAEIAFVAPVREGDELVAEAVERTRFGRNGIYDVTVYRGTWCADCKSRRCDKHSRGTDVVAEFRGRSRTVGS